MEDHHHQQQQQINPSSQDLNLEQDPKSEQNHLTNTLWSTSIEEEIEEIIGYKFNDRNLLQQAFTHSSYSDDGVESYERLEYMGDSVLNTLIAKEHYLLYPDLAPGKLTRLRAANVDTEKLARVAVKHNLYSYLRHRTPLLYGQIKEFKDASSEYPLHSCGLIDAPKVLADIVESIIGAIFIDSNFSMDITWQVVKKLLQPIITPKSLQTHPVTKLHEMCQKTGSKVEFVDLWRQRGEYEVFVNNEYVGRGQYHAKKLIAQNRAADNAYYQVVRKLGIGERIDDDD